MIDSLISDDMMKSRYIVDTGDAPQNLYWTDNTTATYTSAAAIITN